MTMKDHFRALLRERKHYSKGSPDHAWRTRAARKLLASIRGVPAIEWGAL